ncbi:MAG: hypothetical protein ACK4N5_27195 [Myxococcales bacterium]
MGLSDEQLREAMRQELERRARVITAYPPDTFGVIEPWEWILAAVVCVALPLVIVLLCA